MRSWRLLLRDVAINEIDVEVSYADVFVVLRDDDVEPGPNDWEATVRTPDHQHFPPGTYELRGGTARRRLAQRPRRPPLQQRPPAPLPRRRPLRRRRARRRLNTQPGWRNWLTRRA